MRARATAVLAIAAMVACGGSTGPSGAGSSSAPAPSAPDAGPAPAPAPAPDAGPAPAPGPVPDPGPQPPPPAPPAPPLAYSVTDLGKGFANFVDAQGRVAGSTCDDTSCSGAVYSAPGGWSVVPVPAGAVRLEVAGIDANGRLALNVEYPFSMRSTRSLPYRWPPLELLPILATDPKDFTRESRIAAMNPQGHLVGRLFDDSGSTSASGGYFYDGAVTRIAFAQKQNNAEALALNSHDQVVGWVQQGPEQHAFLWDRGTLRDLGTVSGASTMATGINDSGVVTGWGATSPTSGVSIVFRWDGEMHPLGCPEGTIHCEATAINARGDIVGQALTAEKTEVAFVYRDGSFHRIDDLVQGAEGWHFILAASINDAGQIAGTGELDGHDHAYLLAPR
jgi:probable HAF family extracellular repeat protein